MDMTNTAAQDLMRTIDDANIEQSDVHLSAQDVATLWDELLVLRGIRYRAGRANSEAMRQEYDMDARAVTRYILGNQS